jgi:hypothetical protein
MSVYEFLSSDIFFPVSVLNTLVHGSIIAYYLSFKDYNILHFTKTKDQ